MITKTLDRAAFSTSEWMAVEHHSKRQEAIAAEVATLREELKQTVDVLASKIHSYKQSQLFRALRWLGLLESAK